MLCRVGVITTEKSSSGLPDQNNDVGILLLEPTTNYRLDNNVLISFAGNLFLILIAFAFIYIYCYQVNPCSQPVQEDQDMVPEEPENEEEVAVWSPNLDIENDLGSSALDQPQQPSTSSGMATIGPQGYGSDVSHSTFNERLCSTAVKQSLDDRPKGNKMMEYLRTASAPNVLRQRNAANTTSSGATSAPPGSPLVRPSVQYSHPSDSVVIDMGEETN